MAEIADRILQTLQITDAGDINSLTLAEQWQVDHQKVVGAIKSLEGIDGLIVAEQVSENQWIATSEGQSIISHGSYEYNILRAVPAGGGILLDELNQKDPQNAKIGFAKAMQNGWVKLDKQAVGGARVFSAVNVQQTPDRTVLQLQQLLIPHASAGQVSDKDRAELKKRKLAQEVTVKSYRLKRGLKFTTRVDKVETDLTTDMLAKCTWKDKTFKAYNFNALGVEPQGGHFHPLLKVKSEFRQIFLEMGFSEMHTNNYVENSFWNFDALFQPQDHPARDMQDTFFLSHPATSETFPDDYVKRVKQVHSEGDYGSQGYGTEWRMSEAKKNVLRTHTTAVSARVLYALAQRARAKSTEGHVAPCKYFSIDRVFRNETLDATHLAEFHQIEGVVGDYNLSMAHMIGIFTAFFSKLGLTDLRFKPTYNPYTEPSMEIYAYHSGLQKHVEIGNSGLFRPEMLRPMGLPEGYRVAGWGLSLERPTMILYGIDNIRDLCGHNINLKLVQESPICLFRAKKPALTEHGGPIVTKAKEVDAVAGKEFFDKHHDQP